MDKTQKVCFAFQNGKCERENCKFAHVASAASGAKNTGQEQVQAEPPKADDKKPNKNEKSSPAEDKGAAGTTDNDKKQNTKGKSQDQVCHSWAKTGKCKFGDNCRFAHSGDAGGASPKNRVLLDVNLSKASFDKLCNSFPLEEYNLEIVPMKSHVGSPTHAYSRALRTIGVHMVLQRAAGLAKKLGGHVLEIQGKARAKEPERDVHREFFNDFDRDADLCPSTCDHKVKLLAGEYAVVVFVDVPLPSDAIDQLMTTYPLVREWLSLLHVYTEMHGLVGEQYIEWVPRSADQLYAGSPGAYRIACPGTPTFCEPDHYWISAAYVSSHVLPVTKNMFGESYRVIQFKRAGVDHFLETAASVPNLDVPQPMPPVRVGNTVLCRFGHSLVVARDAETGVAAGLEPTQLMDMLRNMTGRPADLSSPTGLFALGRAFAQRRGYLHGEQLVQVAVDLKVAIELPASRLIFAEQGGSSWWPWARTRVDRVRDLSLQQQCIDPVVAAQEQGDLVAALSCVLFVVFSFTLASGIGVVVFCVFATALVPSLVRQAARGFLLMPSRLCALKMWVLVALLSFAAVVPHVHAEAPRCGLLNATRVAALQHICGPVCPILINGAFIREQYAADKFLPVVYDGPLPATAAIGFGLPAHVSTRPLLPLADGSRVDVKYRMESTVWVKLEQDRLYAIGIVFDGQLPVVSAVEQQNMLVAAHNRQCAVMPGWDCEYFAEFQASFVNFYKDAIVDFSFAMKTFDEWNLRFPLAKQAQHICARAKLLQGIVSTEKIVLRKAFIKVEKLVKFSDFDPRCITGATDEFNVIVGPALLSLAEVKNQFDGTRLVPGWSDEGYVFYATSTDSRSLGSWFERAIIHGGRAICGDDQLAIVIVANTPFLLCLDGRRHDAHMHSGFWDLNRVTYELLVEKAEPQDRPKMRDRVAFALNCSKHTRATTRVGVTYEHDYRVRSGDPDTTMSNTKRTDALARHAWYVVRDYLSQVIAEFGDWALVPNVQSVMIQCFEYVQSSLLRLGYEVTGFVTRDLWRAELLSGIFLPVNGTWFWAPKPGRWLEKVGWTLKYPTPAVGISNFVGAVKSFVHYQFVPFLRSYLEAVSKWFPDVCGPPVYRQVGSTGDLPVCPAADTWATFSARYGICESDERAFEEALAAVTTLPHMLRSELIARLADVDRE